MTNEQTITHLPTLSKPKRHRATKLEVELRRATLVQIVADITPCTVRQVFYQATVHNLVEKTESGYCKIQDDLTLLRRAGEIPYGWIVDLTRSRRQPWTYSSPQSALEDTARSYRKSLWDALDCHVQIWLEKDALAGTILPVTDKYDVSLMIARGYSSISFLHEAGEELNVLDVPIYIYHLGDHDPSGRDASRAIEDGLRDHAPDADIHFERLAVTQDQIETWGLPTRPTKTSDPRSKSYDGPSVELDAIPPDTLRSLVEEAVCRHMPTATYELLMDEQRRERELIARLVAEMGGREE